MEVPAIVLIEKALAGTAWVWSRFSDQVTVTVRPSAAIVAETTLGAVVSTTKERVALKLEVAGVLSTLRARQ